MDNLKQLGDFVSYYHTKQHSAFQRIFRGKKWKSWKMGKVLQEARKIRTLGKVVPNDAVKDLQDAIRGRIRTFESFPFVESDITDRHRHCIAWLDELENILTRKGDKAESDEPTSSWKALSDCFEDETQEEFMEKSSLSLIDATKQQILVLWAKVKNGDDIIATAIVSNSLYSYMIADLRSSSLLNPELPSRILRHAERLDVGRDLCSAKRALQELLQYDGTSDNAIYLNSLCRFVMQNRRQYAPPILLDFLASVYNPQREDIDTLSASVCVLILLGLRDDWIQSKTDIVTIRRSVVKQHSELVSLLKTWNWFLKDKKNLDEARRLSINSCTDIWYLGYVSGFLHANRQLICKRLLELPLIPAFAHLYVFYVLKGNEKVDTLEDICKKFPRFLFWNDRPSTKEGLVDSFQKWILLAGETEEKISASRQERQKSLLCSLYEGYSRAGGSTLQDIESLKGLGERLNKEILDYKDVITLYDVVSKTAKQLYGEDENLAVCQIYRILQTKDDPKPWIDAFLEVSKIDLTD